MTNTLYYGDNLSYLREFDRESVDLIYLDPPFNSQATYNLLFRDPTGKATPARRRRLRTPGIGRKMRLKRRTPMC
jgi:DNA modification methylase